MQLENTPLRKHLIPGFIARSQTCACILKSGWAVRPFCEHRRAGTTCLFLSGQAGNELGSYPGSASVQAPSAPTRWGEEGADKTFAEVPLGTHVLCIGEVLITDLPLGFRSHPQRLTCLLTIESNISVSTRDLSPHSHGRTEEKRPMGRPD